MIAGMVAFLAVRPLVACTAFFMFDGMRAIAGQNEDWIDPNTQIWFVPASSSGHGIVYFGFGKGRYPAGGISYPKSKILDLGIKDVAEITNFDDAVKLHLETELKQGPRAVTVARLFSK